VTISAAAADIPIGLTGDPWTDTGGRDPAGERDLGG